MDRNGQNLKKPKNGQTWAELDKCGPKSAKMGQNGPTWAEMGKT